MTPSSPWLRFYGNMPHHIDYPDCTLSQLVLQSAKQYPKLCAYEFMGRKTSFSSFAERVERTARALYSLGIRKGDRVTICMPNTPQALDCFYALNRIGAISNMIHPLSAKQEITFYLDASDSKAILSLDRFYGKVSEAAKAAKRMPTLLIAKLQEELPPLMKLGFALTDKTPPLPKGGSYLLWSDMLKHANAILPEDDGKADDCACILYSGGTTGTNKGIRLSNRNLNALALQTIAASGYPNIIGKSMLSVMPIFHGFGLGVGIHTALVGGARCILVPNFSVKTYAKLLRTKKPNFIPGVPTLFEALLRAEKLDKLDMSFLMGVFSGGDSLSVELKRRVDAFLKAHHASVQIREGYGMTECVAASCLTPFAFSREGSIGIPFPDTYYKIVKPNTQESTTDIGEICISGETVMLGYLDNPEETAQALQTHADGRVWLHTGDLGQMDADGFVYFKQRLKRMIVSSGYNIYPSQIEGILDAHEAVQLSCVIGVKDPYKMQRIKAYVVLRPEFVPSEALKQELFAYCRERIAKFSMPSEIEFRAELPKTPVGKVAYRVLEEENQ